MLGMTSACSDPRSFCEFEAGVPTRSGKIAFFFSLEKDIQDTLVVLKNFTHDQMEDFIGGASKSVWSSLIGRQLHEYAARNDMCLVEKFVAVGATNGNALNAATMEGHDDMVQFLLGHGFADPLRGVEDSEGNTPLHTAVRYQRRSIARLLLEHGGTNMDAKNSRKLTALFMATRYNLYDMVLDLLEHGADPNIPCGHRNRTTLHVQATYRDRKLLLALLQSGASVDACMLGGLTALHLAAFSLDAATVDTLLERCATVDARTKTGRTPLFLASANTGRKPGVGGGAVAVVRSLLMADADQRCKDNEGDTPVGVVGSWRRAGEEECIDVSVVESVRGMLVRADADRAWRRRGLLVMILSSSECGWDGETSWALFLQGASDDIFRAIVAFL